MSLEPIIIDAAGQHTSTIIFLHGLGDTGAGWEMTARMLAPTLPNTKWILPHAIIRPITINGGLHMNAWYDVPNAANLDEGTDEGGMLSSVSVITEIINAEVSCGIPANKIVVGGFSQGSAISILTGLMIGQMLAGVVCLSGRLPLRDKLKSMVSADCPSLPVFAAHGTADLTIPFSLGLKSIRFLKEELHLTNVTFLQYDMNHSVSPIELQDLSGWLLSILASD